MSIGSKKDSFGGTPDKNEDIFNYHALHNFKLIRHDIMEDPGPDVWGYGDHWIETEPRALGMNGIGNPCWVVEVTPCWPNWWFEKREVWFDKMHINICFEKAFDARGRLIRTANFDVRNSQPDLHPTYMQWANWDCADLLNDIQCSYYGGADPNLDGFFDTFYSETIFSRRTLLKELTSLEGY
jgi:hypothetical protein